MNELIKQAYAQGATQAAEDLGLSKTAWFGQNVLRSLGNHMAEGAGAIANGGKQIEKGVEKTLAQRARVQVGDLAGWMSEHPELAGGAALGAGALGAGAAGYALAPEQKPWYHFGQ